MNCPPKNLKTLDFSIISAKRNQWLDVPQRILAYVKENTNQGDVSSIIDAIDYYSYNKEFSMSLGDVKGKILDEVVQETDPNISLELGTYCGYGSLRIARLTKPNSMHYSIESNPNVAAVAREMIKFAGMENKITVLDGKADQILPTLSEKLKIRAFDFVFIDHWKELYKSDFILLENLKLVQKGTVILADNVLFDRTRGYLEYVRNSPKYECTTYPAPVEYTRDIDDALEKSVCKNA